MADKISFVLYTRYREQINLLNNEQAGQLMKAIFDYQAGEDVSIADQVVAMLWSVMKQQLDTDNQKYQETCAKRKEAGAKGGKSKTSKSKNAEANQANAFFAKQTEAKQADNDIDIDCDIDIENDSDISSSSNDDEDINNSAGCRHRDGGRTVPYGREGFPTTQVEIAKFEALAARLCMEYKQKPPNKTDKDKVFAHVYTRTVRPDGEAIAIFDQQKAALLEYAFEQAAEADKVNWRYIAGIYKAWARDGVDSMQKVDERESKREFERQQGMSTEEFMQKFYGG